MRLFAEMTSEVIRRGQVSPMMRARLVPGVENRPDPLARQWFRRRLLAWYGENGRDLPWRKTRDPTRSWSRK